MRIISKLIISVVIFLVYVQAVRAQETLKLNLDEQVHGVVKKITETIYSKKRKKPKFIKTYSEATSYSKRKSYNLRPVNLYIYHSDEKFFTTEPKDTVNIQFIDVFNKDGNKLFTYWRKKTDDSGSSADTIYKIKYQFVNSDINTGYKKINADKKVEWQQIYQYNKRQLLSHVTDYQNGEILNRKIKIDYLAFDLHGNWIKRRETTTLKDGTIAGVTIVKRTITYY